MGKFAEFLTKCRLCASITNEQTVVSLFVSNDSPDALSNKVEVCDIILNCLNIEITKNDELPVIICKTCFNTVNNISDFRTICHQTNIKLKNELECHITSLQQPKIENDITLDDNYEVEVTEIYCEQDVSYWNSQSEELIKEELVSNGTSNNDNNNTECVSEEARIRQRNNKVKKKNTSRTTKICEICGKESKKLSAHMKFHIKRRVPCPLCPKTFSQTPTMKIHLQTHGEKKYKCEHCDMLFACYSYLRRHRRLHTGERNYVCQICMKAFNTNYNLKTHLRIHTKEKPFQCEGCSKAFAHRATFNIHRKECKIQ